MSLVVGLSYSSAQTSTATLRVLINDSTSGNVPNASLTLTDVTKGLEHTGVTNNGGQYTFPLLDPGIYSLQVQATGFASYLEKNIVLEVGQSASLSIGLKIGSVTDQVTVHDAPVQLETASGALGSVIDRRAIDQLPLNGRNPYQLAQLNSSVTSTASSRGANPNLAASVAFSIGGGRSLTNEILLDGSPITGRADNWPEISPSADSVQEFRVQTNSYSAEYGRALGGTLNVITRSGANAYHATLWEFFRNDALDANTFFGNVQGLNKGELRYNQFGGNAGGRIVKDKLFFFTNFEGLRIQSGVLSQSTVPTAKMKTGDFSELKSAIYQPNSDGTRTAFANNIIPPALQNPVGRKLLSYYPDPNRPGPVNNYVTFNPTSTTNRQLVTRLDYQISSTQNLFFRLARNWDRGVTDGNFPGSVATTTAEGTTLSDPLAITLDYVNTLGPHTIVHGNASVARNTLIRTQPSAGFDPTTLGFPSYLATASGEGRLFPTISVTGYATLGPLSSFGVTNTYQNTFSWAGDLTRLQGPHSMKMGGNYRAYQVNNFRANDPAGAFAFTRGFTARTASDGTTGDPIASLLLGLPNSGDIGVAPRLAAQNAYFGLFFQDDWTISPKLTVNVGLRWESDLPTTERFNRMTNFATMAAFPISPAITFPAALNLPPRTGSLLGAVRFVGRNGMDDRYLSEPDLNNFAPRAGLAYKLTPKTVVRAGGGIFYAPMTAGGITAALLGMLGESVQTTYVASLDNGVTPAPGTNLSNPFPNGIQPPPGSSLGALTAYGNTVQSRLRDLRNPMNGQWNLSVQRELPGSIIVEAAYAGSVGIGLIGGNEDLNVLSPAARALGATVLNTLVPNPFAALPVAQQPPSSTAIARPTVSVAQLLRPYPQFGTVTVLFENHAHSTYHALQLRMERRFSANLYFRASYTFSKMIDDISGVGTNTGVQAPDVQDPYNRRLDKSLSTYDARHRFVSNVLLGLPFGHGKALLDRTGPLDWILGGWTLNTILSAQEGFPLSIGATAGAGQVGLSNRALRPNLVGDPRGSEQLNAWFNTGAFAQPASFQVGTSPRTLPNVRGPGYLGTDLALHKNFSIRENMRLQFRLEAFNAINRANFTLPGTVLGTPAFGVISGTENPRQVQIAAKLYF